MWKRRAHRSSAHRHQPAPSDARLLRRCRGATVLAVALAASAFALQRVSQQSQLQFALGRLPSAPNSERVSAGLFGLGAGALEPETRPVPSNYSTSLQHRIAAYNCSLTLTAAIYLHLLRGCAVTLLGDRSSATGVRRAPSPYRGPIMQRSGCINESRCTFDMYASNW